MATKTFPYGGEWPDPPAYYEEAGWPKSAWNNGQFEATRRLICDWEDRLWLIDWLGRFPNGIYPYTEGPLDPPAIVVYAGIEGMGEQGSETQIYGPGDPPGRTGSDLLATYPKAKVTAKYTTEGPRLQPGGTLLSEWLRPTAQTHALSHASFSWDDAAGTRVREGERPYFTRYGFEHVVRLHQVIAVPPWVTAYVGTCNLNPVAGAVIPITYAPQTLIYQPPTIQTSIDLGRGLPTFDITVHFKFKPTGWNTFPRESTGQDEPMYVTGGSQYIRYPPVIYAWPT